MALVPPTSRASTGIRQSAFVPTGAIARSLPVEVSGTSNQAPLVSQRLSLFAIELAAGWTISTIQFQCGGTALVAGVNQFAGIYDDNAGSNLGVARALLRGSTNLGATAWGVGNFQTFTLTTPFSVPTNGVYFIGLLVDAGTVPSLVCAGVQFATGSGAFTQVFPAATANAGVTALPNPASAMTIATVYPYFILS